MTSRGDRGPACWKFVCNGYVPKGGREGLLGCSLGGGCGGFGIARSSVGGVCSLLSVSETNSPLSRMCHDHHHVILCCAAVLQAMKINAKMGGVNVKLLDNPAKVSEKSEGPCVCEG